MLDDKEARCLILVILFVCSTSVVAMSLVMYFKFIVVGGPVTTTVCVFGSICEPFSILTSV